jgi:hypothetical protein
MIGWTRLIRKIIPPQREPVKAVEEIAWIKAD